MILYNDKRERIIYNSENRIGEGYYGYVYLLSSSLCIKVFKKRKQNYDRETFTLIRDLHLKNFYNIKSLLYTSSGNFGGYTMEYYDKEDINILTMPSDYTLYNLFNIYSSIEELSKLGIFVEDLHTGNVVLNSKDITVIDTDLYHKVDDDKVAIHNCFLVEDLFRDLYLEALNRYCIESNNTTNNINKEYNLFKVDDLFLYNRNDGFNKTIKRLCKYKYPIDYIRKRGK